MQPQDSMRYHKPPDCHVPPNQAPGDAYLQRGSPGKTASMYREAQRRHPGNGWPPLGLAASLRAMRKQAQAAKVGEHAKSALRDAAIPDPLSLFRTERRGRHDRGGQ